MIVKQLQDGGRQPPSWKSIYRHISVKNNPILMKFFTQQQILNWMNVTWSKMKKLHWTDSEFDRTYFLFPYYLNIWLFTFVNFQGLARVAIHGVTWVNFQNLAGTRVKLRFLAYPVNSGRPAWSKDQTRGKLPMATAQATCVSAGEWG